MQNRRGFIFIGLALVMGLAAAWVAGRFVSNTPAEMAAGPGRNVAQAYARFAQTMQSGTADTPDFEDAVVRHALIDAMERSHIERKAIKLV